MSQNLCPLRNFLPADVLSLWSGATCPARQQQFWADWESRARHEWNTLAQKLSDNNQQLRLNHLEQEKQHIYEIEAPGLNRDDLDVTVKGNTVTVKGKKQEQSDWTEGDVQVREYHVGSVDRAWTLPLSANPDAVTAAYRDGILKIVVDKRADAVAVPPLQIPVTYHA